MPRKKLRGRPREVVAARLKLHVWRALRTEAKRADMPIGALLERMIEIEVKRRKRRRRGSGDGNETQGAVT